LFRNTFFNSTVKRSGLFRDVFIPANPGNAGLSLGCALSPLGAPSVRTSPFLGPSYTAEEIKSVLDNCKLRYEVVHELELVTRAVNVLRGGGLVGWFQGRMEFGPRALGNRSILADPLNPFALMNLNGFLKQRPFWRTYALSAPAAYIAQHFEGPAESPFMECDFRPRDREPVRHLAPSPHASFRIQTLARDAAPALFLQLHDAFAAASRVPLLVNTSFNGFHEPIVCSPRDAVRVFYGSGLDALAIGPFWLAK
jgi:carbamoyltransferase